ncbi:hypothetical protein F5Y07DRAFT_408687 [Xylaria sp. FL0933]|nr:hypothetical protein F5Y07DRAFT_408687 [Xylaria sp. FL0933]
MLITNLLLTATCFSSAMASRSIPRNSVDISESSKRDAQIVVTVGKGSFKFSPDTITANPGDEIVFEFWSDGHSVARSAFGFPCIPYEYITPDSTGFFSGEIVSVTSSSRPRFTVTVDDTEPIFFYDATTDSCKMNRMIGVINPNSSWTLDKQNSYINSRIIELQPGDPIPSEFNGTESISPDAQYSYDSPPLSRGEIVGVVISALAILLIVASLVFLAFWRQRRMDENGRDRNSGASTIPFVDWSSPQWNRGNARNNLPPQAQQPNSGH